MQAGRHDLLGVLLLRIEPHDHRERAVPVVNVSQSGD